jgi:hypothetical protein
LRGRRLSKNPALATDRVERIVTVLDRSSAVDLAAACRAAHKLGVPLLVLSVGYPQDDSQDAAIRAGLEVSWNLGVKFEAVLVPAKRAAREYLRNGDALLKPGAAADRLAQTGPVGLEDQASSDEPRGRTELGGVG